MRKFCCADVSHPKGLKLYHILGTIQNMETATFVAMSISCLLISFTGYALYTFTVIRVESKAMNHPIYMFQNPLNPQAVIIFFHDILWGEKVENLHTSPWMSSSDPPVCWPETWLRGDCPKAQILSTCYDSGIWKGKTTGYMDLYILGENLRQDILATYTAKDCPIFLVGHGLGGLVIKALIKEMQEKRDALARRQGFQNDTNLCKLDYFLKNVKGILYYNTPFLGSKLTDWTRWLPCRGLLLGPLKVLSTEACRLNYWFSAWQADRGCRTKMIWAGCPTSVGLWYRHLVEEGSARSDINDGFYTVGGSDHVHICKPRDKEDVRYKRLTEFISPVMLDMASVTEGDAESACAEFVKQILGKLRKLEPGWGLQLKIDEIAKIRMFEDLWSSLSDALQKACLEKTSSDGTYEHWEPQARVCERGFT